jgi:hypothetical protein
MQEQIFLVNYQYVLDQINPMYLQKYSKKKQNFIFVIFKKLQFLPGVKRIIAFKHEYSA